jgi:hypothetical protein
MAATATGSPKIFSDHPDRSVAHNHHATPHSAAAESMIPHANVGIQIRARAGSPERRG